MVHLFQRVPAARRRHTLFDPLVEFFLKPLIFKLFLLRLYLHYFLPVVFFNSHQLVLLLIYGILDKFYH